MTFEAQVAAMEAAREQLYTLADAYPSLSVSLVAPALLLTRGLTATALAGPTKAGRQHLARCARQVAEALAQYVNDTSIANLANCDHALSCSHLSAIIRDLTAVAPLALVGSAEH
jgi:hypothetical protein